MKITTLIVDDEAKCRNTLRELLKRSCPQVQIIGEADSVDAAYKLILEHNPQLIFLDVEMPYGNGFDLLQRLPHLKFEIVFVTGFDQYALRAIKFHALDYLLKPLDLKELIEAVKKAEEAIYKKQDTQRLRLLLDNLKNPDPGTHRIAIPTIKGREFIPVEDIMHCQADGGSTWLFLKNDRKLFSSQNLGTFEKILPAADTNQNHRFFRIHHSHLINIAFLKKYNNRSSEAEMQNGATLAISQRRKSKFIKIVEATGLE